MVKKGQGKSMSLPMNADSRGSQGFGVISGMQMPLYHIRKAGISGNLTISGALRYYLKVDIDLCPFSRFELVAFTYFGGCPG